MVFDRDWGDWWVMGWTGGRRGCGSPRRRGWLEGGGCGFLGGEVWEEVAWACWGDSIGA